MSMNVSNLQEVLAAEALGPAPYPTIENLRSYTLPAVDKVFGHALGLETFLLVESTEYCWFLADGRLAIRVRIMQSGEDLKATCYNPSRDFGPVGVESVNDYGNETSVTIPLTGGGEIAIKAIGRNAGILQAVLPLLLGRLPVPKARKQQ
jgi:hypothetical protein